jgi:hypothetical protein
MNAHPQGHGTIRAGNMRRVMTPMQTETCTAASITTINGLMRLQMQCVASISHNEKVLRSLGKCIVSREWITGWSCCDNLQYEWLLSCGIQSFS